MSDFISDFWSYYIAAIALLGIVWCAWLLLSQRRIKLAPGQKPDGDTGHVWDGDLRELNNPLPRWWMWMFLLSCVFAVAYLILYPGLGAYGGMLGFPAAANWLPSAPPPRPGAAAVCALCRNGHQADRCRPPGP